MPGKPIQLSATAQIVRRINDTAVQVSAPNIHNTYVHEVDGRSYQLPTPLYRLTETVYVVPQWRGGDKAGLHVLDTTQWCVWDLDYGRRVGDRILIADHPDDLVPFAERYMREAQHLDSIGVQAWFNRYVAQEQERRNQARRELRPIQVVDAPRSDQ